MNNTSRLGSQLAVQPLLPLVNQQKWPILAKLIGQFGDALYEYLNNKNRNPILLAAYLNRFVNASLKTIEHQAALFTLEELKILKSFAKTYTTVRRLEHPFIADVQKEYRLQLDEVKKNPSDVVAAKKVDLKFEGISQELIRKVGGLAERYMKVLMSEVRKPANDQAAAHVLNKFSPELVTVLIKGDSSEEWSDKLFEFVQFMETPLGARYSELELEWLNNVRQF